MESFATFFSNLVLGAETAISLANLFYCFVGVFIGTVIGVLPGIGPMAAIAMLLPATFDLPPVASIIMLAGIYYGAMYGGSTTSILMKLPGEAASVVTCIDGYEMAKQGRAGPALAIAAVGSFFAGTVCTLIISVAGPPLSHIALDFEAPEYFSLMLMGLIASALLAHGNMLKAIGAIILGLILGIVGTDVNSSVSRFTFGASGLADGISIAVVAMGLFGFSEILINLGEGKETETRDLLSKRIHGLMPTLADIKVSSGPILRGTAIGAFFGLLPGASPTISAFASYAVEKKMAKDKTMFGKGAIQGVAGPESANNATVQCAFIPTLTLGIPVSGTMALMLGALMIHGISPGPQVMTQNPDLFWGLIVSMWIGNGILLILNLPMISLWVKLLQVPYRFLFPAIMVFMAIGVYTVNNLALDIYLTVFFGIMGYVFMQFKIEPAPLILAFVLGPLMEEHLRRALLISRGDPTTFITHPISAVFLAITAVLLSFMVMSAIRKKSATTAGR
jgi:putative tricarboxylic transport membrane protein